MTQIARKKYFFENSDIFRVVCCGTSFIWGHSSTMIFETNGTHTHTTRFQTRPKKPTEFTVQARYTNCNNRQSYSPPFILLLGTVAATNTTTTTSSSESFSQVCREFSRTHPIPTNLKRSVQNHPLANFITFPKSKSLLPP